MVSHQHAQMNWWLAALASEVIAEHIPRVQERRHDSQATSEPSFESLTEGQDLVSPSLDSWSVVAPSSVTYHPTSEQSLELV